jgi:hypothetical protein
MRKSPASPEDNPGKTQRDLQIQCSRYQNFNILFFSNGKANPHIYMELQVTLKSQNNL